MTEISFTSGEIMDIMSMLELKINQEYDSEEMHLSHYYLNLYQQFGKILNKVEEFQPEYRVAHLVLACN